MSNILITGASSGIGYATALQLHNSGNCVIALCREANDVAHLQELGIDAYCCDVSDFEKVTDVFNRIVARHSHLDVVFNNAGYGQPGALEDIELGVFKQQFETNFFALVHLTQLAIKQMRTQKGGGKIVQHGSILGLISLRFRGAYNASKYAIEGYCDTLRLELQNTDIKIITLNTGPVKSRFRDNAFAMFEKNIDREHSEYKKEYAKQLSQRFEQKDDDIFTMDTHDCALIITRIISKQNPKPRYAITKASALLMVLKRLFSTKVLDTILAKLD
ncbi:MAG: SDR family NAD(P)-dependent oxidoreductase [Campylobacterota bacterium]